MRCKACDKVLTPTEMYRKLPDGNPEDLCHKCRAASRSAYTILEHYDNHVQFFNGGLDLTER